MRNGQRRIANHDEPTGNNLLRALRPDDAAVVAPLLEQWKGELGQVIYEPGDDVRHAYFPCGPSLVSYRVLMRDGQPVETALIGREGAVGGIVSHGRLPAYARAEVQFPGLFLRIETAALEEAKQRSPSLRQLFARYADCLMAQVFQSVACNATHSIEQRTAKWLASAMDRTDDTTMPITQEQLATMLGVGRSYISRVIHAFKSEGVVETRRGGLVIKDVALLNRLACECNHSVRDHFDEVLKGIYPAETDAG